MWEGRYRAGLVETDRYLLACMRYIELNPVRAAMVEQPSAYCWSSFQGNAHGAADPVLTPHPLYDQLGADPQARAGAYRELFSAQVGQGLLGDIRATVNQELVLGSTQFRRQVEAMPGRQADGKARGRPRIKEQGGVY